MFGKETLTRPLPTGTPPRPVLIKILHFKDRDIMLRKAREMKDVMVEESRVAFYPDYPAEIKEK